MVQSSETPIKPVPSFEHTLSLINFKAYQSIVGKKVTGKKVIEEKLQICLGKNVTGKKVTKVIIRHL